VPYEISRGRGETVGRSEVVCGAVTMAVVLAATVGVAATAATGAKTGATIAAGLRWSPRRRETGRALKKRRMIGSGDGAVLQRQPNTMSVRLLDFFPRRVPDRELAERTPAAGTGVADRLPPVAPLSVSDAPQTTTGRGGGGCVAVFPSSSTSCCSCVVWLSVEGFGYEEKRKDLC
jgi:hypothetical protein